MHILHECDRFRRMGFPCPMRRHEGDEHDEERDKRFIPKAIEMPGEQFDDIIPFLHRDKKFREAIRRLEGQEIWEPFSQEFPEPLQFPSQEEIRPGVLRPAAQQASGGLGQLNRIYSLRGMELLRQNQRSLRPSQVRTIERQSAKGLSNLRVVGGRGRTITSQSGGGSGRGFVKNAAAQLKRDIGLAASFRKEDKKKEFDFTQTWTSTFPAGYFG